MRFLQEVQRIQQVQQVQPLHVHPVKVKRRDGQSAIHLQHVS